MAANIGPLFRLGQIVATHGALKALKISGDSPANYIAKHSVGDWGDLCAEDCKANDEAIDTGLRIISSYRLTYGTKLWTITEADRSSTYLLLPSEY